MIPFDTTFTLTYDLTLAHNFPLFNMIQDLGKSGPLQIEHDGLLHSLIFYFYDSVL
jgi:hypothetical protein